MQVVMVPRYIKMCPTRYFGAFSPLIYWRRPYCGATFGDLLRNPADLCDCKHNLRAGTRPSTVSRTVLPWFETVKVHCSWQIRAALHGTAPGSSAGQRVLQLGALMGRLLRAWVAVCTLPGLGAMAQNCWEGPLAFLLLDCCGKSSHTVSLYALDAAPCLL